MFEPTAKHKYMSFRDWSDYLNYVTPLPSIASSPDINGDHPYSWSSGRHGDFFGTSSFDNAMSMLQHGWQTGSSRVLALRASLDSMVQAAHTAKSSALGWSHAGEWLHVGRAIHGRPDCFARAMDVGHDTCDRVVTIAMNASCSASTNSDAVFMRGAVALCLVDVLETLGHRVELLFCTCATRSDGSNIVDEVNAVVKKPSEHLDIDRLAFLFCNRDGARRIGFRYYEHQGRIGSGRPTPMKGTPEDFPGCVIVPEIKHPNTPQSVVRDCLKAAGIELDVDRVA
jgi:hypothetical protein